MVAASSRSWIAPLLCLVVAAIFVVLRWNVTTDISQFLPEGEQREQGRILQAVSRGVGSRTIVATLPAADRAEAARVSRAFEAELRADPALVAATEFIDAGPPEGIDEALWTMLEPRRLSYVAATVEEARARITPEGLAGVAEELKARLSSPMSTFVARTAPSDPFLAVPRLFEGMQTRRADALEIEDGRFVAQDRFAVVFLGTRASALDATAQREILAAIDQAAERVRARHPGVGALETSALGKYSIAAETMIRGDIQRTTTLSLVGLTVLCLGVFGSLRLVALASLPIGAAMLMATAVSLAWFGQVHGLTYAFGASLIGVCIDYVVHLYVHNVADPARPSAHATLRKIWPALGLGATTTICGFAIMAGSSFPGLRQVAVFATVGVATALVCTRTILPHLMRRLPEPGRAFHALAHGLRRGFARIEQRRGLGVALFAGALVAAVAGVFTVEWDDDLQRLQRLDPVLVAEDEAVRARVARFDQSRFVVALGDSEEEALAVNDVVVAALGEARAAGELVAWQNVAPILPSAARQRAIADVLRRDAELPARLAAALDEAGFDAAAFEPFFAHLRAPEPPPLTFTDLVDSPAATLVRPLRLEVDGRVAFLSLLREVADPDALARRLGAIEDAHYIDQGALMTSAMRGYRVRTTELLVLGWLAVPGILALRFRRARVVLAAFLPAVLSAGVTVGVLALLDLPLNLIGLTSVLMVISIGVDYGVFLAEARLHPDRDDVSATLIALVLCWLTTLVGFGALVLSQHPAMFMIGVVAAVGVTSSLLLAPMSFILLPAVPRS